MSIRRPVRAGALLLTVPFLVSLGLGPVAPAHAAEKKKLPPPVAATSWVGGERLIDSRPLTDLPAGVKAPKAPKAVSWLVADLDTGSIVAARRAHVLLPPASTLKLFTALALAPRLDPKAVYTGQESDANIEGTKVGIVRGSKYTVDDLLHGMLMTSGNDCANALANEVGGVGSATALMQAEALRLGAFDTVIRNPSGLDAKGQVSSAYDLALAGTEALRRKQLTRIMLTRDYQFPGKGRSLGKKRHRYFIPNHDRLVLYYPGAIGGKNGFTTQARGTFVGAAHRDGHTYLAVVMRSEGPSWKQAADLLDWAFATSGRARPVGRLVVPGELSAKVGPGVLSAATTPTPSPGSSPSASGPPPAADGAASQALPAADAHLTRPAVDSTFGKIGLTAAAAALIALAWFTGRRFRRPRP
jgi:serine-type D-Ala-D-Ala carboxypeptidase (penicillin-binding protein 5/6)